MAHKTVVTLVDDLDGSEADETVEFGLDGVTYELDLTSTHAAMLRDGLADYVAHARRQRGVSRGRNGYRSGVAGGHRSNGRNGVGTPATLDREQNRAIRDWARKHGLALSDRGRIPSHVTQAFHRGDASALDGAAAAAPAAPERADNTTAGSEGKAGPDGLTSSEREQIRSWAQNEGIEVKSRGRLTKDLIANYRASHTRT